MLPDELTRLIAEFRKLPSVGLKNATRYAYAVIDMDDAEFESFVTALTDAKANIRFCKQCGEYSDQEICPGCQTADPSTICVVKEPRDITAIEKTGCYQGLYHVLHGTLDFQKGIGADRIRIKELMDRLEGVKEVIVALNPDMSGEMTAAYLGNLLRPLGIKVTRLAHGIPMGCEIEYADELTLMRALNDRKEY